MRPDLHRRIAFWIDTTVGLIMAALFLLALLYLGSIPTLAMW